MVLHRHDQFGKWAYRCVLIAVVAATLIAVSAEFQPLLAQDEGSEEYRELPAPVNRWIDNRTAVWIGMQLHLMFGAFVLGVPIFALIVEVIGMTSGDERFDKLAKEFMKLISAAFSTTAALGGLCVFLLIGLYPKFTSHWSTIFHKSFYIYGLAFFGEAFSLYLYYYSWNRLKGVCNCRIKGALSSALLWFSLLCLLLLLVVSMVKTGWMASMVNEPGKWITGFLAVFAIGQVAIWFLLAKRGFGTLKMAHLGLGLFLNFFGIFIMVLANTWTTHMMAPTGVSPLGELNPEFWNPETKEWLGPIYSAVANPLWAPINIHRLIANVTFGGFIVGAYAAVMFLTSRKKEDLAHYDWMGYIGNFVGIAALIPLPFAGYYLGREVYGTNPSMGLLMMGGGFSWAFIIQAILIGMLFIGVNYYLWIGMGRVEGDDPYSRHIKFLVCIIFLAFAVWLTPHNLPLSGQERALIGEQYHKFSSWFGVMVAKNAAVQLIILATFFSFLLYQRRSKGEPLPFRDQGPVGYITVSVVGAICIMVLMSNYRSQQHESVNGKLKVEKEGEYKFYVTAKYGATLKLDGQIVPSGRGITLEASTYSLQLNFWKLGGLKDLRIEWEELQIPRKDLTPEALGLTGEKTKTDIGFLKHIQFLLGMQMAVIVLAGILTFVNFGKLAQAVILGVTIYSAVVHLSAVIGYDIMARANPLLRNVSVTQVLLVITCLLFTTFVDIFLYRKAKTMTINWGKMPVRSQYVLLMLCITIVMLMGLMGFIRSGLRENWHVTYILRDTSQTAFTPTYTYMAIVVASICAIFLSLAAFVFWLAALGDSAHDEGEESEEAAADATSL